MQNNLKKKIETRNLNWLDRMFCANFHFISCDIYLVQQVQCGEKWWKATSREIKQIVFSCLRIFYFYFFFTLFALVILKADTVLGDESDHRSASENFCFCCCFLKVFWKFSFAKATRLLLARQPGATHHWGAACWQANKTSTRHKSFVIQNSTSKWHKNWLIIMN